MFLKIYTVGNLNSQLMATLLFMDQAGLYYKMWAVGLLNSVQKMAMVAGTKFISAHAVYALCR